MPRPRGRQGNVRTASVLKAWATVQRPRKASRETGRRGWLAQGRQQGFPRKKFQLPAPVCTLCRCFRGSNRTFSAVCNVQTKGKPPPPSLFLSFLPSFLVVVVVVATPRPNPISLARLSCLRARFHELKSLPLFRRNVSSLWCVRVLGKRDDDCVSEAPLILLASRIAWTRFVELPMIVAIER